MKIAVIGSRTFDDYDKLKEALDNFTISKITSGGAVGADSLAEVYAKENNIPTEIYMPQWDLFGKKAGLLRNATIVENSDVVVVFWDKKSRGSRDSIRKAYNLSKPTFIVYF